MPTDTNEPVHRNIAVVGASAGGVEALQQLVHQMPAQYPGSLLLALHMGREASLLHEILAKRSQLPVISPRDHEPLLPGRVYLAIPDHHLVLDTAAVRVVKGPMLHRHRPAIDVLFRSAAAAHGPRVVGVVLTGVLDDGTAGLLEIKRRDGVAVVQDPTDATFPDMPKSALRHVAVDYALPLVRIPRLLVQLARGDSNVEPPAPPRPPRLVDDVSARGGPIMSDNAKPSAYSCPECHGVLWEIDDPVLLRFRCRVGHGYSADSLAAEHDDAVEDALWAAVRSLEEQASLSRRMADQWRVRKAEAMALQLDSKAALSETHALRLRGLLMPEELGSKEA